MPKQKNTKSNVAIWRIDTSLEEFVGIAVEEIVGLIGTNYKKRELKEVPLESSTYEGKNVKAFWTTRFSDGLQGFLGDLLPRHLSLTERQEIFSSINKDLVVFIYDEKDIFAITSGAGYFIIQEYVDERFPFEVAKRLLRGDFRSAEIRDLTGVVYSQSRNFRRDYNFSRKEAFGKVWKKLTGGIDSGIIKASAYISDFIADKSEKNLSADVKSSFTFRKTVKIGQMFGAIKEIQVLLEKALTDDQKRMFGFLDTLKEVTKTEVKDALRDALADAAFAFVRSTELESDFDFCHPREMTKFLHGTNFEITDGTAWEDVPTAADVLVKIRDTRGLVEKDNITEFKEGFFGLKMTFQEDEDGPIFSDDLWRYFHGEVELGGKKYFLIDGKWYEVVGEFLAALAENFIDEVFGDNSIITDGVPFMTWDNDDDEGAFNVKQSKAPHFYFGDEVFLRGEKGKIELFDLLFVDGGSVYIIQVKNGFGASIRDACSQIQMAAESIERDLRTHDRKELGRYYNEFKNKNPDVSKEDFFKLLDLDRRYVLAVSPRQEFSKDAFVKGKHKSDIAKFEVLGISHEFRADNRVFRLTRIKKTPAR